MESFGKAFPSTTSKEIRPTAFSTYRTVDSIEMACVMRHRSHIAGFGYGRHGFSMEEITTFLTSSLSAARLSLLQLDHS